LESYNNDNKVFNHKYGRTSVYKIWILAKSGSTLITIINRDFCKYVYICGEDSWAVSVPNAVMLQYIIGLTRENIFVVNVLRNH